MYFWLSRKNPVAKRSLINKLKKDVNIIGYSDDSANVYQF
jgi:hypothetical protein